MAYIEIDEATSYTTQDNHALTLMSGGVSSAELLDNAFLVYSDDTGAEYVYANLGEVDAALFAECAVIIGNVWLNTDTEMEKVA